MAKKKMDCRGCRESRLDFELTMAFQPILDVRERRVFAHEALVRGVNGEGAGAVLGKVTDDNRYAFDQACREMAVSLASRLELPGILSINFLPNAIYEPQNCLRRTLAAARRHDFDITRIMFEVTEVERVRDSAHLHWIFDEYRQTGFTTAIDDFGAGFSGLNLLAEFSVDVIKIDMALIRDIHKNKSRQAILSGILTTARSLDILVIAEGIETRGEYDFLMSEGVRYMQGFMFAKPAFEGLPEIEWPEEA